MTDDENTLFRLNDTGIIRDGTPLTEHYRPTNILARNNEKLEVGKLFSSVLKANGSPINAIIYGNSGVGKNLVVEYITDIFIVSAAKRDKKYVRVVISCKDKTLNWIYQTLLTAIDPSLSEYSQGRSPAEVYTKLAHAMKRKNTSIVLILDEMDKLPPSDVLYDLTRIKKNGGLPQDIYLMLIGLTNKYDHCIEDQAIASTFGSRTIHFPTYNAENLEDILNDRTFALYPNTLDEGIIKQISIKSAREHGNARKAIELLFTSAEIAEESKSPTITAQHVEEAYNTIEIDNILKELTKSPRHRILSFIALSELQKIKNGAAATTSPLFKHYEIVCDNNLTTPLSINRFTAACMELYNTSLIEIIEKAGKNKRGRSKLYKIIMPEEHMNKLLDILSTEHGYVINGYSNGKNLDTTSEEQQTL